MVTRELDRRSGRAPEWSTPRERMIAAAVTGVTGRNVLRMTFPGGRGRASVRCHLGRGQTVIATVRRDSDRLAQEVRVQRHLQAAGAPVPDVLGVQGSCLVQADAGPRRLSEALNVGTCGQQDLLSLLFSAAETLLRCQGALRSQTGPLPVIGGAADWRRSLASVPLAIGRQLGVPVPAYAWESAADFMAPNRPVPVKWDARPGNAIPSGHGVIWIDWDHCGLREPIDDLVWLLCDEFAPDVGPATDRFADRFAPLFRGARSTDEAQARFRTMGVLHCAVRVQLILSGYRRAGKWSDFGQCLSKDKIGRTGPCLRRLCARAERWCGDIADLRPLAAWFRDLPEVVSAPAEVVQTGDLRRA